MSKRLIFRLFCLLVLVGTMTFNSATTARAERTVIQQEFIFPLDYINFYPCINNGSGDYLHVTGTWAYHIRQIIDPLDPNSYIMVVNSHISNASAVSLTTGMKYQVSGTDHYQHLSAADPLIVNSHGILHVVGQGKNNNLRMNYALKIVMNKDGKYVVYRYDYSIGCENPIFP